MLGLALWCIHWPKAAAADSCYVVSDGSSPDRLLTIDVSGSPTTDIGPTGRSRIEAIALSLDGNTIFAANQVSDTLGEFGTLDTATGAFSLVGAAAIGTGTGALGAIEFADVDGLATDPFSGIVYGSVRREASATQLDVLVQIDPATGTFVPDAFGPDLDYVPIDTSVVGLFDVDDIAVDPADGQMFGVANDAGGDDRLVEVDKFTGAVTDVGQIRLADGTAVTDMEGFSFSNDGVFYGTTGASSVVTEQRNSLWQIDPPTGVVTLLGAISIGSDHEGVGCLTSGANTLTGTVFQDLDGDGVNDGEPGQVGVTVRLYVDSDNDGQVGAMDALVASTTSAADGSYAFELATVGSFVVDIGTGTLPANSGLTTDNIETAVFATFGNLDEANDFGFAPSADLQITKTASTDPVSPGATLVYTLTVTNNGPIDATGVVVNDLLPAAVTWVSTVPSQGGCSSPGGVTCELGTLASGATATLTITVTVN